MSKTQDDKDVALAVVVIIFIILLSMFFHCMEKISNNLEIIATHMKSVHSDLNYIQDEIKK